MARCEPGSIEREEPRLVAATAWVLGGEALPDWRRGGLRVVVEAKGFGARREECSSWQR